MKRSRFSEEQIAYVLRLAESGTPVVDVYREIGVSEATYYTWKKRFGDLGVSELKRIKMLEDEQPAEIKRITLETPNGPPLRPRGIAITADGKYAGITDAPKGDPTSVWCGFSTLTRTRFQAVSPRSGMNLI